MKSFEIETVDNAISSIYDLRYSEKVDITDGSGDFAKYCYTEISDDITKGKKPNGVPYLDKLGNYTEHSGNSFLNHEYETSLTVAESKYGAAFELTSAYSDFSQFGIYFSLNTMGYRGGNWESQLLPSSPFYASDHRHFLYYFTRPDGNNTVFISEYEVNGYRLVYTPTEKGSFIKGIEILSQFDRAYGRKTRKEKKLKVHMCAVKDYTEAFKIAAEIWDMPAVYYSLSSGKVGNRFYFNNITGFESIEIISPLGKKQIITENFFVPKEYGIYAATPVLSGKKGIGCSFFAFDDFGKMFYKACLAAKAEPKKQIGTDSDGKMLYYPLHITMKNGYEDNNLCEHCMWAWSDLKYMRIFGISSPITEETENLLRIVMTQDKRLSIPRCTISREQNFNTYNSRRIQEAYNGVNILTDAYRLYKNRKYLDFAAEALTARIKEDMNTDGAIFCAHGEKKADYTTVTPIVIPIADMCVLLKAENDSRYKYFEESAIKIADFIVSRGFDFPTESTACEEFPNEKEDGSISCSALSVLYVAANIVKKSDYIDFARKVLEYHNAWTCFSPHPVMYHSGLRWWETLWEGNGDGFAFCYGHAWSIWKAEAQYWYGLLCGEDDRITDSYNGFMCNLSKEDADGNLYSIYQYEAISSGGFTENSNEVSFENSEGFPYKPDFTISRYAFARASETWFKTVALITVDGRLTVLGGRLENNCIIPEIPNFERLYLGDVYGDFSVKASENYALYKGKNCNARLNRE